MQQRNSSGSAGVNEAESGAAGGAQTYALRELQRTLRLARAAELAAAGGQQQQDVSGGLAHTHLSAAELRLRAEQWRRCVQGVSSGSISVGSRRPLGPEVPAWVTPVVLHGGFASPDFLAGGPLAEHETALLAMLRGETGGGELLEVSVAGDRQGLLSSSDGANPALAERLQLNEFFASARGVFVLTHLVETGFYQLEAPEEGALLVAAWLASNGYGRESEALVAELRPFFDRIRFFPRPADFPLQVSSSVFVETWGDARVSLQSMRIPGMATIQKEVIGDWLPMYDKFVELFVSTLTPNKPVPTCVGAGARGPIPAECAWPLAQIPNGWQARAAGLVKEFDELLRLKRRVRGFTFESRRRKQFQQLVQFARRACGLETRDLSGRDVGFIRKVIAVVNDKRGLPGMALHEARRLAQRRSLKPSGYMFAQALIRRVEQEGKLDFADGVDFSVPDCARLLRAMDPVQDLQLSPELAAVAYPAAESDAGHQSAVDIPGSVLHKLLRASKEDLDKLVEQGEIVVPNADGQSSTVKRPPTVSSAEMLAKVLPQISGQVQASGIADPALRRLATANYMAFKLKRRSLLLLNLSHQVTAKELPWIQCLEKVKDPNMGGADLAQQVLTEVARVSLTAFPQTIVPNKLLQEYVTLARQMVPQGSYPEANSAVAVASPGHASESLWSRFARLVISYKVAPESSSSPALTTSEAAAAAAFKYPYPMPLVDEIAADIFEHAFSVKFSRAAHETAALIDFPGSLYSTYYGLCEEMEVLHSLPLQPPNRTTRSNYYGATPVQEVYDLAKKLAGPAGNGYGTVANGAILEQEQIMTSHNLAVLFTWLEDLAPSIGWEDTTGIPALARKTLDWIFRRLVSLEGVTDFLAGVQGQKNAAYAWRQLVFFLTLMQIHDNEETLDDGAAQSLVAKTKSITEFLAWARSTLLSDPDVEKDDDSPAVKAAKEKLRQHLEVLELALSGTVPQRSQRFLARGD